MVELVGKVEWHGYKLSEGEDYPNIYHVTDDLGQVWQTIAYDKVEAMDDVYFNPDPIHTFVVANAVEGFDHIGYLREE